MCLIVVIKVAKLLKWILFTQTGHSCVVSETSRNYTWRTLLKLHFRINCRWQQ